jgi:hypothetical protein
MPRNLFVFVIVVRVLFALLPAIFQLTYGTQDYSLNRWDAPHYLWIAEHGYTNVGDPQYFIVFQPLFPIATRLVSTFGFELQTAGILLSVITFVLGSVILYKLVLLDYTKKAAALTVVLLSLFPTSYFFSAPYTESLFFALATSSLYFARKHCWAGAGVAGGLAVLTRHVGLLLIIPLFIEWLKQKEKRLVDIVTVGVFFSVCFYLYLLINLSVFGDPFAFQKILHEHWYKTYVPFWQSLKGSWEIALGGKDRYNIEIGWWEVVPATLSLLLIPFIWRTLRRSYAAYYTAYVLFITSTSFLLSTARYVMSIPPLFIFLAIISGKNRLVLIGWIGISVYLLMYFSKAFVSGQWAF